jgi:hypothetical protein
LVVEAFLDAFPAVAGTLALQVFHLHVFGLLGVEGGAFALRTVAVALALQVPLALPPLLAGFLSEGWLLANSVLQVLQIAEDDPILQPSAIVLELFLRHPPPLLPFILSPPPLFLLFLLLIVKDEDAVLFAGLLVS